jgi:hypothetical protein
MKQIIYAVRPSNKTFSTRCTKNLMAALGGKPIVRTERCPEGTTMLVHWGFKQTPALQSAIEMKIPFVVLDRGYFEPTRTERVSISINGHHGLSMPVDVLDREPRWHPDIQDWRADGSRIYVCGQVPGDAALRGADNAAWMGRTASEAADRFGLPVIKRPHPRSIDKWEQQPPALERTFEDSYLHVTYSSTTAVQSVLAGVPTVAMHPASPAFSVCSANLERLCPVNREAWAHTLAWREYTLTDPVDTAACAEYLIGAFPEAVRQASLGNVDTKGINR